MPSIQQLETISTITPATDYLPIVESASGDLKKIGLETITNLVLHQFATKALASAGLVGKSNRFVNVLEDESEDDNETVYWWNGSVLTKIVEVV